MTCGNWMDVPRNFTVADHHVLPDGGICMVLCAKEIGSTAVKIWL